MGAEVTRGGGVPTGELRDVDVKFLSLVDKGANKRQFQIFKAAEGKPAENHGSDEERAKGLGCAIMEAVRKFMNPASVEKSKSAELPTFNAMIGQEELSGKLSDARWVLHDVIQAVLMGEAENKQALIAQALDEHKAYVLSRLQQVGISKALEEMGRVEVEKAGRKISSANRAKLESALAAISELLALDAQATEGAEDGGDTDVTKQELEQVVQAAIEKAMEPVDSRLKALEGGEGEETVADSLTADKIGEMVGAAIEKALEPVATRIETLEKARGNSQVGAVEDMSVSKSNTWGGLFL